MNKYLKEKLTKLFNTKNCTIILSACLSITTYGANIYWTNTVGGVFSDSGNWNPSTVPGVSDGAYFDKDGDYTVQFTGGITNNLLRVYEPTSGGTLNFDIGADNIYSLENTYSFYMNNGANAEVISGWLSCKNYVRIGDNNSDNTLTVSGTGRFGSYSRGICLGYGSNSDNNKIIVTGSDAFLDSRGASQYMGALTIGNSGSYNQVIVENGANLGTSEIQCKDIVLGRASANSVSNSLIVRTDGKVNSSSRTTVGRDGSYNIVEVDNSTFTNTASAIIGATSTAHDNTFICKNGSDVFLSDNAAIIFTVGQAEGSSNNTIIAQDSGTTLWFTKSAIGLNGWNNSMIVSNGAAFSTPGVARDNIIGCEASASNNLLHVTGSGSSYYVGINSYAVTSFVLGYYGADNRTIIDDGATAAIAENTYIGRYASASNNILTIASGGKMDLAAFYIGGTSVLGTDTGNKVFLENGRFTCTNATSSQICEFYNGSTLEIAGTNSIFDVSKLLLASDCTLSFKIGENGYSSTPIQIAANGDFSDGTTVLSIDAKDFQIAGGGEVELMTFGSASGSVVDNMILLPENIQVTQTSTNVVVYVPGPSGTIILIK